MSGSRPRQTIPAIAGSWMTRPGLFLRECDNCAMREERVFRDSWTGKELCLSCLGPIVDRITSSPASEGDNLLGLLDPEDDEDA